MAKSWRIAPDHTGCRNSDRSIEDAQRDGACPTCDGAGQLLSTFGGRHVHVPCPECARR
ncbi:hypothetical protein [Actinocorallia aurantiaca]|uniref:Molecular chaperone DnaJ n=1 Tax=Actinocorallia aurantiaca TaxID=46204 RepID=A0ABN3U8K5_9ACTN